MSAFCSGRSNEGDDGKSESRLQAVRGSWKGGCTVLMPYDTCMYSVTAVRSSWKSGSTIMIAFLTIHSEAVL